MNNLKKVGFVTLSVLIMSVAVISPSQAALAAGATAAFTTLQTDALALIDLAWTVAVPVVSGFIILHLFKTSAKSAV